MRKKIKNLCRLTTLLLIVGFSISLTAVLIGISAIDTLLKEIRQADPLPVLRTMQDTGLSLAGAVYLFSIINCFTVTNYWITTRRTELAVRKAFGWSSRQLIGLLTKELAQVLLLGIGAGGCLTGLLMQTQLPVFRIQLTAFFVAGTLMLMLVTLGLAAVVPAARITSIHPAEVVS